ncbi:MAG TPA: threonine synthase [Phycisphaerae bacterium]|nr:threonine synthase [Phycisphaerae bacterium]HNU46049.1 threonine synthase [Phycisphaerae bacterium]
METGERYPLAAPLWRSSSGGLLDVEFEARLAPARIAGRPASLWRYREALPITRDDAMVSFGEGMTPLVPTLFAGRKVYFKLEYLFPTGSYKDRGATVLLSKVRELGVERIVEDSSGNAGAAIACYAARAGIACDIYVPAGTSAAKLTQIELFGARLHQVPGTRADAARAAFEAAQTTYYASHCWNPFFFQGTKTFAFEVVEQLGWTAPDAIIIPTGNGTLLYGTWLGLRELRDAGIIDRLPKLIAVQAEHCAPLYEAWRAGRTDIGPVAARDTVAEGIAIAAPVRARQCLQAVRETEGRFIVVSEGEIRHALREMLTQGFFIEPTAAAAVAGLLKYNAPNARIVVPLTGHGLKAADKLARLAAD